MIHELVEGEFTIYSQIIREATDDYTARKIIKDRKKLRIWLINLLEKKNVIIHYIENEKEQMAVLTGIKPVIPRNEWEDPVIVPDPKIPDGEDYKNYITGFGVANRQPYTILLDSITKFVVTSGDIVDISNSINWYDEKYN